MRGRGGGDDARRRRGDELVAQRLGQHEIGHVVEREGQFEAFGRHPPLGKEGAGVVDQDVDARLARGDRRSDLARLGHAREIRQMHAMAEPGRFRFELAHRRLRPSLIAGDDDDPGAHSRELEDRGFADARGRAGRDNGLALHPTFLWLPPRTPLPFRRIPGTQKEDARSNGRENADRRAHRGFDRDPLGLWWREAAAERRQDR